MTSQTLMEGYAWDLLNSGKEKITLTFETENLAISALASFNKRRFKLRAESKKLYTPQDKNYGQSPFEFISATRQEAQVFLTIFKPPEVQIT